MSTKKGLLGSFRDKDGSSHKRQKSRDKSAEKKNSVLSQSTMSSISAAFSKVQGKGRPALATTFSTVHATITDVRTFSTAQIRPLPSDGIMSLFKSDPQKKLEKEQAVKIKTIRHRLSDRGYLGIEDEQIDYALRSQHAKGDVDKALELEILFQESVDGVIKPSNPAIQMKGAVNRELVTCYLDSLLFAMFGRLGSFEPILYSQSGDQHTRRLSTLIRLWVNMLRTGILIEADITQHLQEAIAACGWEAAAQLEQQDTSEAFNFITATLKLPLLTLKMDIFHNGTEVDTDDHKFIHERLLEVAVPDESCTLEACLEHFFNNRVEIMRPLERSNTISSVRSSHSPSDDKANVSQTEVVVSELSWSTPNTPLSTIPPNSPLSPGGRHRTDSIIRHRIVTDIQEEGSGEKVADSDEYSTRRSIRKGSIRKEVLMPAWQFFNLIRPSPFYLPMDSRYLTRKRFECPLLIDDIAWYTKSDPPSNDAEVAANFSHTPPVLGICLKRYAMSPDGTATRKNTFIDIPIDIRLPHFVDDSCQVEGQPLMENFKLSLQSVICHQGNSVQSGHYISIVREPAEIADGDFASSRRLSSSSKPPHYSTDRWIKHDDIGRERISYVNIEQVLEKQMPYLLFYQIQPIHDFYQPAATESEPPAYEHQSSINVKVSECSPLTNSKPDDHQHGYFDETATKTESAAPSVRFSADLERHRYSMQLPESRRGSTVPTENSLGSATSSIRAPDGKSNPVTPTEETTVQRLSRAASRIKSGSKSRPTSSSGENRISATFSRIGLRSKEQLNKTEPNRDHVAYTTDGAADRDSAIVMEDSSLKLASELPRRSRSTRGRSRGKSKDTETRSKEKGDHHHKMKNGKEVPDRECTLM